MSERHTEPVEPANESLFESAAELTPVGSNHFSLNTSEVPEHPSISPLYASTYAGYEQGRPEFLAGSELLGLTPTGRKKILPLQYQVADVLQAVQPEGLPWHTLYAICAPRRVTKTTSWWAVALGRISNPERDAYAVAFTAQTQAKARIRFLKDVVVHIERKYPDPKDSPYVINRGAASASITCKATGGSISILGPNGDSFRGDAYDLIGVDESQEIEPGPASEELLQGILPTLITRPGAQLVFLGTAGKTRDGVFWDQLEQGRAGKVGILEYGASENTPDYDPEDPESVIANTTSDPEVWALAYPGIGGLVSLEALTMNFNSMSLTAFKREYLGIWPTDSRHGFVDPALWFKAGISGPLPAIPKQFAMAFAVHPDNKYATVALAWAEGDLRHVGLFESKAGVEWLAPVLRKLWSKYKIPIHYNYKLDSVRAVVEELQTGPVRPKLNKMQWSDVSTASVVFMRALDKGSLRHHDQAELNTAAANVTKKVYEGGRWAFAKREFGDDITGVEAAALALLQVDRIKKPQAIHDLT